MFRNHRELILERKCELYWVKNYSSQLAECKASKPVYSTNMYLVDNISAHFNTKQRTVLPIERVIV